LQTVFYTVKKADEKNYIPFCGCCGSGEVSKMRMTR
jgi:predicted HAD superfamily hydrolase